MKNVKNVKHVKHVTFVVANGQQREILFFYLDKPIGASPRRDYVRSEEDGIRTNRIVSYFYSIMV